MKNPVKRVAAIHDLSGFGRASLTAIIPILSSMGIQVCPLPTAVLSSHTGGFKDFTFVDLTDNMRDFMQHWEKIGIEFDCIYTGFIGSGKQADIILDFIDKFKKEDTLVVVDPVMGDGGKRYPTIDDELVEGMKRITSKADIIVPNFSEAHFLLGTEYTEETNIDCIKEMLKKLSDMGPEKVVMTSVPGIGTDDVIDIFAYERADNKFWNVKSEYIPVSFPGTGDAFASGLIGGLLNDESLPIAINRSAQFILNGINESYGFDYPRREGILLEKVLNTLKMPMVSTGYREI